jgi:hypothetical protein
VAAALPPPKVRTTRPQQVKVAPSHSTTGNRAARSSANHAGFSTVASPTLKHAVTVGSAPAEAAQMCPESRSMGSTDDATW